MGKVLVIKGADFSANAIGSIYFNMDMAQGAINNSESYFGMWEPVSTEPANKIKTAKTAGVKVGAGNSQEINVSVDGLSYRYYCYTASEPTVANCVKAMSNGEWTAVSNKKITLNNTADGDRYYFIVLKWNGTDGVHADDANIAPSDVDVTYL